MDRPLTEGGRIFYILNMKPVRTAGRCLRIAIAMAFGFMSLGHGPIMSFAHAAKPDAAAHGSAHASAHQHGATAHAHHDHDAAGASHDAVAADETAGCNAFGCFITVGTAAIEPPPQAMMPIGKLLPPLAPASLPIFPEPADPPPRLHG